MAKPVKMIARGCKQDRARVAGGQNYESRLWGEEDAPISKQGRRRSRKSATAASGWRSDWAV